MKFQPGKFYHVYNEGNNKEQLFFTDEQYAYFMNFFRSYIQPHCNIIAWSLLPNHFHFLIAADQRCLTFKPQGRLMLDPVTNGFRKLLSGYAHHFNKNNNRSGALFRPKTKSVCLNPGESESPDLTNQTDFLTKCIFFIQNNPVELGLVKSAGEWKWSSFHEYEGMENVICNIDFRAGLFRRSDVSSDEVVIQ